MATRAVEITWLGHATFLLKSRGKTILIDPWVQGNPACPKRFHDIPALDAILITHGHFDHVGDTVAIAKRLEPQVVANYETATWLEGKGVRNTVSMNKGGTVEVAGARVTMVAADHSCGILDDGRIVYGGAAAGFVVEFPGPYRIYHAGDTNGFGDMRLIGELYRPDLALLPIGGHYTMGPIEAAHAVRLLGVREVVPMHFGTFPALAGTPAALRGHLADRPEVQVRELEPGGSL
ncbi:MAG: metal-dependent hydrolase [Acidobacteria bacterium]|nr:metal-dependent hydrolase [Acidobacteriota bacterium]